jgi:tetratricopeptide (TPR) repeat protein
LEPEFAQAWILRARIHRKSGQPRQALADYHRALGLDPAEREVLMELAELHLELAPTQGGGGRPDLHRSLAALQALADTYPQGEEPTHVLLLTGVVLLQLARPHAAAEVLARASQRQPPDPDIYCRLAEAQLAAGQPNAAWESIQRAMAIAPGHAPSAALFQQIQWRLAQGASATARR